MTQVQLVWATPDADAQIMYCARVSNPANQTSGNTKLLRYCMEHGHVSPFEMANTCLQIDTTRDITHQIIRHRSFHFQEFCIAGNTKITLELPHGERKGRRYAYQRTIEHLYKLQESGKPMPSGVRVFDEATRTFKRVAIKEVFQTGVKPLYRLTLANGKQVECTKEHKFLTEAGWESLEDAIGLREFGSRAGFTKECAFACNGVAVYTDFEWLAKAKEQSIANGGGLEWIANAAGCTTHTIRKWLKRFNLQFAKMEVASYTQIWNKGLQGYKLPKHRMETIEKMRKSARRGPDSNLWRGGTDRSERLKIADWCAAHRSEFLKSANYQCHSCKSSERLELHHVKTVAEHPELAYDKGNIQVLCEKCHDHVHGIAGDHKTWRAKSSGNTLTIHWSKIVSIEAIGERMTYDMEVDHESHNYVANGIVTHNSQRYADVDSLGDPVLREARMQDSANRQNSLPCMDDGLGKSWHMGQRSVWEHNISTYRYALRQGVAKEVARAILPEGLTPSRLYMNGTLRSWVHYLKQRLDPSTQKEHREVAEQCLAVLRTVAPVTMDAFFGSKV